MTNARTKTGTSLTVVELADRQQRRKIIRDGAGDDLLMPTAVRALVKEAGRLAAFELMAMLQDKDFRKLPVRDRANIIQMAMNRAYGTVTPAPTETHKSETERVEEQQLGSRLSALAGRVRLPELQKGSAGPRAASATKSDDET